MTRSATNHRPRSPARRPGNICTCAACHAMLVELTVQQISSTVCGISHAVPILNCLRLLSGTRTLTVCSADFVFHVYAFTTYPSGCWRHYVFHFLTCYKSLSVTLKIIQHTLMSLSPVRPSVRAYMRARQRHSPTNLSPTSTSC